MSVDCQNCTYQFGKILRKRRLLKGLSQEKLAAKADLSTHYIGHVERGVTNPSLRSICLIAKALDITIGELLADVS